MEHIDLAFYWLLYSHLQSAEFLFKEHLLGVQVGQSGCDASQDEPKDEFSGHHHSNSIDHLCHIGGRQVSITCVCKVIQVSYIYQSDIRFSIYMADFCTCIPVVVMVAMDQ